MQVKNLLLFTFIDWCLIDVWVQMIVPSTKYRLGSLGFRVSKVGDIPFTALLASASSNFEFNLELVCNKGPLFCAVQSY